MTSAAGDKHPDPDATLIGAVPGASAAPAGDLGADSDATVVRADVDGAQDSIAITPQVVLAPALTQTQAVARSATAQPPQRLASLASLPDATIMTTGPVDRSKRRAGLLFAVGLAGVAVAYALAPGSNGAGVIEAVAPAARGAAALPGKSTSAAMLAPPRRNPLVIEAAADPFVGTSFAPPPPPPPPPAPVVVAPPPPPPTAPPLPYSFVGMLEKGPGKPAAFISRGSTLLVVSAGDVVEDKYRVDVLNPSEIVMTSLPLNQRQSLNLSGKNP